MDSELFQRSCIPPLDGSMLTNINSYRFCGRVNMQCHDEVDPVGNLNLRYTKLFHRQQAGRRKGLNT